MATAKFWVNNQNFPHYMTRRKETTYIQTWHGTPLKKMLFDLDEIHGRDEGYVERVTNSISQWSVSCLRVLTRRTSLEVRSSTMDLSSNLVIREMTSSLRRMMKQRSIGFGRSCNYRKAKKSFVCTDLRDHQSLGKGSSTSTIRLISTGRGSVRR